MPWFGSSNNKVVNKKRRLISKTRTTKNVVSTLSSVKTEVARISIVFIFMIMTMLVTLLFRIGKYFKQDFFQKATDEKGLIQTFLTRIIEKKVEASLRISMCYTSKEEDQV